MPDNLSAVPFLPLPVRTDLEDPLGLYRIVRLHVDREEMRAAHPLVHGELGGNFGLFPWPQGRRTDDHLGGSATLYGLDRSVHV